MLTSFRLHNFRTYLDTKLSFGKRHLLIGRNNSGKTNLARALKFLSLSAQQDLTNAAAFIPGGVEEMGSWQLRSDLVEFECECKIPYQNSVCEFKYSVTFKIEFGGVADGTGGPAELRVKNEKLILNAPGFANVPLLENDGHESKMLHEEGHLRGPPAYNPKTLSPKNATMLCKLYELENNRRAIHFRKYLSNWAYFSLNPDAMRYGWQSKAIETIGFWPGGDNLAHVIYQLKNWDELKYRQLLAHVQTVEPALAAFNFVPTPGQTVVPFVVLKDRVRASWAGLSDGTLRVLAMAYIAEANNIPAGGGVVPTLSIIEEPENGVAPAQLRRVFELFEERAPQSQFLFTSHSPYFIDMFDNTRSAVTVLKRRNGRTECETPQESSLAENADTRLTLSEEYAAELIG